MTEGAAYLGSMTRTFLASGGWTDQRGANLLDGGAPNYRCYEGADGRYVAVGALEPRFWTSVVGGLGLDPDTTPSPYDPAQWDACAAVLADSFARRTRDEWAAVFEPLDACVAPVLTLAEAPRHPHNAARGSYVQVGEATMPGPAPRFSATPGEAGRLTEIAAATDELLVAAGFTTQDLERLRESGTIAGTD
jgi:alpha-methylacyl-CoA racemase